jgi:polysaccharide export outer membrane protein
LPEAVKPLRLPLAAGDAAVLAATFPSMPASAEAGGGQGPVLVAPGMGAVGSPPPARAQGAAAPPGPPRPLSPAGASLLLPPEAAAAARSQQLERTARQADQQVRHGFELANRRAYYAARAEFVAGLRMVAQALDAERHTTNHSRSLSAGLTALKEAGDFLPSGGRLEADLDLPTIIASHRTPVLKNAATENLVPLVALKAYFTFAQEQLSAAAGHEVAGSMALYALGKLHATVARQRSLDLPAAAPKAVVFYQASLVVCGRNYLSANDLGVVLAESGYYAEARAALEYSARLSSQSANLGNLAVVYGQLGQSRLAAQARQRAEAARRSEIERLRARQISAGGAVRWVDPRAFAQTGIETPDPPAAAKKSLAEAIPWELRVKDATLPEGRRPLLADEARELGAIRLCQALGPAAPYDICGVDSADWGCFCNCRGGWEAARLIQWQQYAQGEYVGHYRLPHVPQYRFRVDDQLDMIYRITRDELPTPYRLNVGDEIRVESLTDTDLDRNLLIQPDGTITLRLLGQVHATGRTVAQLTAALEDLYKKYYKVPAITVTPLKVNTQLDDLRNTIDRRAGIGGQSQLVRVTPEGLISLPAIGAIPAQGLTLQELQQEINERYREKIEGMEVIPALSQRAARYCYVMGEVNTPGRFELLGPTTVLQAMSMAGSWRVGANLRQIVIFRRGDDWRLLATMVNLDAALRGKQPCPAGELWLSDSDVIIVPKSAILVADDFINLVFTRGIYGVFPMTAYLNLSTASTLPTGM